MMYQLSPLFKIGFSDISDIFKIMRSYLIMQKNFYSMIVSDFIITKYTTPKKLLNLALILVQHYITKGDRVIGYPIKAVIDPISYCNLRCPLCPTGRKDESQKKGFMRFEEFKKIIDEIYEYLFVVDFYNWGEPLMNKDVFRMIKYAHEKRIKTRMSSNITLLTKDKAKMMIESGLDVLIASIDGVSEETYSKYRVGGNFNKVMDNLINLVEMKRELGAKNPEIIWQFIVMRHNEHEVEKARGMAKKLGVKIKITPSRVDMGEELHDNIEKLVSRFGNWLPQSVSRYVDGKKLIKPKNCLFLWTQVVINPDGSIAPCCGSYSDKDNFGNVFKEGGVIKAWNNKNFMYARKVVREKNKNADIICVNCLKNGFLESN